MHFDSLIVNANALLDLQNLQTTENTIIGIKDGVIRLVEHNTDYHNYKYNKLINLGGALLTPGLVDCHTHLIFAGDRSNEFRMRLEGSSYEEISRNGGGIKSTVDATRASSETELLELALQRIRVMQSNGATTIEIKSGYGLSVDEEIKILRVAKKIQQYTDVRIITSFLGAHSIPKEFTNNSDGYIKVVVEQMLPLIKQHGLADSIDAFCESIAFSLEQTEYLFNHATDLGFRVKLHAEQLSDQKGAVMASRYNALSVDHLEYLDASDVECLAKSGTVAVLLPGAFYFLKETKLPPIAALRKFNVPIAIATDMNPGTSPFLSLPLMMNMGCIYFGLTVAEVWQGVTINAARALGIDKKIGSISMNKQADFAIWKSRNPENVVYNSTADLCSGIIKHGHYIPNN